MRINKDLIAFYIVFLISVGLFYVFYHHFPLAVLLLIIMGLVIQTIISHKNQKTLKEDKKNRIVLAVATGYSVFLIVFSMLLGKINEWRGLYWSVKFWYLYLIGSIVLIASAVFVIIGSIKIYRKNKIINDSALKNGLSRLCYKLINELIIIVIIALFFIASIYERSTQNGPYYYQHEAIKTISHIGVPVVDNFDGREELYQYYGENLFDIPAAASDIKYYQKLFTGREYGIAYSIDLELIETDSELYEIIDNNEKSEGEVITFKEFRENNKVIWIPRVLYSKEVEDYAVLDYNVGNQWTYLCIMDETTGKVVETLYEGL